MHYAIVKSFIVLAAKEKEFYGFYFGPHRHLRARQLTQFMYLYFRHAVSLIFKFVNIDQVANDYFTSRSACEKHVKYTFVTIFQAISVGWLKIKNKTSTKTK